MSEKPEPRVKRKYTKKPKTISFEEPIPQPTPEPIEKDIEDCVEELIEDIKISELTKKVHEFNFVDSYNKAYKKVIWYFYYEGNDIDTLKYIKSFQVLLDSMRLGSQVVIQTKEHCERIGIGGLFIIQDKLNEYYDICLSRDTCNLVHIIERPRLSPEELFEKLSLVEFYKDDFIIYNFK